MSIDPNVNIKDFRYSGGKDMAAFLVGGIVGVAAGRALGLERTEQDEIIDVMQNNDIDIKKIMVSEFKKELAKKSDFPPLVDEGGDAQFQFEMSCMLAVGAFTNRMKPEFYLWASLKDTNGKTIWKRNEWENEHIKGYTHKQYVENPEFLREVFQEACSILSKRLCKTL
ncbi:MAG: hypothetical protein A2Z25_12440 [Planctomycetes bacterium RBG_16_55_9]|nr:MAG: hypothetical protein A2Z25_12440 [Planctomycetes bacterium RBG_16_55_9]